MARDYRNAEVFSPGTRPLPLWLWFFAALAISGFVGLIYYLDQYEKVKSGEQTTGLQLPGLKDLSLPGVGSQDSDSKNTDSKNKDASESTSANKNNENVKDSDTSFDFYKLLPKISVDVPKNKTEERNKIITPGTKESSQPTFNYILQVGSFKDFHEADRLKARLAFLGIVVKIEKVTLNSTDVWHRVRIGPIQSQREMNKIRGQLRKQQIEPIMLKVKA